MYLLVAPHFPPNVLGIPLPCHSTPFSPSPLCPMSFLCVSVKLPAGFAVYRRFHAQQPWTFLDVTWQRCMWECKWQVWRPVRPNHLLPGSFHGRCKLACKHKPRGRSFSSMFADESAPPAAPRSPSPVWSSVCVCVCENDSCLLHAHTHTQWDTN